MMSTGGDGEPKHTVIAVHLCPVKHTFTLAGHRVLNTRAARLVVRNNCKETPSATTPAAAAAAAAAASVASPHRQTDLTS